jgi:hypothetical protein
MRKLLAGFLASLLIGSTIGSGVANAHQPLVLLDTDTSASKGPLIVDGTLSFAVRAAFTKAGQKKAFRAQLKKGEELTVQYLIVDKKPENALRKKSLPALVIISPTGSKVTMKFTERTKFFEPYSRVNYLYLGRYSADAESGIYNFEITSKSKAAITIGVGEKEGVVGEVVRGTYEAPKPEPAGYTMANVRANNSKGSCWSVINGYVYDLTKWISSHPGGEGAIISLCGKDGTNEFVAQHKGQGKAEARLSGYVLGLLAK